MLLETQEKNDKSQGEGFEYYPNGNLKDKRIYKDNIIIDSIEYYQNGKIRRIFKTTEGLKGNYSSILWRWDTQKFWNECNSRL